MHTIVNMSGTEDECVICLELLSNQNICTTKCNHIFHANCVASMNTDVCPLCRQKMCINLHFDEQLRLPFDYSTLTILSELNAPTHRQITWDYWSYMRQHRQITWELNAPTQRQITWDWSYMGQQGEIQQEEPREMQQNCNWLRRFNEIHLSRANIQNLVFGIFTHVMFGGQSLFCQLLHIRTFFRI